MEVVVLEGHSRPGGRVYSKQLRVTPAVRHACSKPYPALLACLLST